jgi:hypothetical protein
VHNALRWTIQAILYGAFALAIGVFSTWPSFRQLGAEQALLRLSLLHTGAPLLDCRERTAEELAKMPAHMRTAKDCPRERSPVRVRVSLDGAVVIDEAFPASGLARDGAAAAYRRLPVSAGRHRLSVDVNDNARQAEVFQSRTESVDLAAGQVLLIDFDPRRGGIVIQ